MQPPDPESSRHVPLRLGDDALRAFVRESRDGIVVIDTAGTIVEWNDGEERIIGIPRADALGRAIWDVQGRVAPAAHRGPEFVRVAREKALRALAEGTALRWTIEEEIERPDGTPRALQSVLFGFRCGTRLYAAAISRDVSDSHRTAEELREQRALLLEAERLVHLGHWTRDFRTGLSTWSDEIFRTLGASATSVTPGGEAFLAAVLDEDRAGVAAKIAQVAVGGGSRRLAFRVVRLGDGAVRHVEATVELLRDPAGAPAKLIGTLQDVTDRVELEGALAAASRNKDEFLAVLSHELRNPLAAVQTGLHVLERAEPGSEQARRMLAIVERQSAQLARLVDDLLDVTRIERGKITLRREAFELGELVRRCVEDLRPTVTAADVRLEARVTPEQMWIKGDPTRITQVVVNLLGNAAKFTPGGGRIEVALERAGGEAVLAVTDTGMGISADMLGRVFEPFAQADRTSHRARGGLGLGLALVRRLAELHGGVATAESGGPGQGARFTVRLPVREGAPTPAPRREPPPAGRCRAVIVDDDPDVAATLAEALRLDGHEVEVALNGAEGLALARALVPDVVLCDLTLPGMDGYDVARAIRGDDALSGTMLVALTGCALPEDLRHASRAGFDRHLAKPATLEAIEEVLGAASRRGARPPRGER